MVSSIQEEVRNLNRIEDDFGSRVELTMSSKRRRSIMGATSKRGKHRRTGSRLRIEAPVSTRLPGPPRRQQRLDFAHVTVGLVPADQMEPNPRNPCSRLTPEERYARFIQILAETYNEMKRKDLGVDKRFTK
jgi:hypothetical protein